MLFRKTSIIFSCLIFAGCGFATMPDAGVKSPSRVDVQNSYYIQKISYVGAVNRTTNAKFVDVSSREKKENDPYDQVTYSYLNNENYFSSILSKKNLKNKINKDGYFADHVLLKKLYENHFPNTDIRRDRFSDHSFSLPDCP